MSEVSGHQKYTVSIARDDRVFAWTGEYLEAQRSVAIEKIEPAEVPAGVRLLSTRITWMERAGVPQADGILGSGCLDGWPPAGFGPAVEPAGIRLEAKDRIAVNYYAQGVQLGRWLVAGTRVTYRVGSEVRSQELRNFEGEIRVVGTSPETDPALSCGPVVPKFRSP